MRLKRLVLQGYKTFASKTEFVFDEGITAVVGPNGSGKSNLADAVRWVLGEQGYAALRGRRTEDMIFAGSQGRARAGMAQAILTLDNSNGWLPIDYSEVEIGRRAYRSGENEYILNGQKVRLRDIEELLATSGLSERTYTIIGQGLIDQALSLRSEERRALFEEAAGISHYKARRAETLRRLQETQRNLERVQDILADITPRLASLKRQAQRAKSYDQVAADLRHQLRIWHGYQWEQARLALRKRRQEAAVVESQWQEGHRHFRAVQEQLEEQRRRIGQLQRQAREKETAREGLRERLEQARRQVAILGERRLTIQRQLADVAQELPALREQQVVARQALEVATADLEAAQANLNSQQAALGQFQATFQAQKQELEQRRQALEQAQKEQRAAQTRLAQAEGQQSQLRERLQERQAGADSAAEIARAEEKITRLAAAVESAQAAVNERRQEREAIQQERRQLNQQLKQMRQEQGEQEQAINKLNHEIARLQARYDLLGQMRRQEGLGGEAAPGDVPLIGRLASLLTIPAAYRQALEAALAARLTTLLVPEEDHLWQVVGRNGHKPLLVAAANRVQPPPQPALPSHPAVIGWASEQVDVSEAARPLALLLLGGILLVRDAAAAYELSLNLPGGTMAVTADGSLLAHAGGLVENRPANADNGILAREEAWREAKAALAEQREVLAQRQKAANVQSAEIRKEQEAADRLGQDENRLGRLEQEAGQRHGRAQRDLEQARQQREFLERQQTTQAAEATRLAERLAEVTQSIGQYQAALAQLEAAESEARQQLQAIPVAEARQQEQGLRQNAEAARAIVAGRQAVLDSRRATLNQLDSQVRRLETRQQEWLGQQEQPELAQADAELQRLQAGLDEVEQWLRPLQTQLAESQEKLAAIEQESAAKQRQIHDLETGYTQVKIAFSQQENYLDGLRERIKNDLGLVAFRYDEDEIGQSPLPMEGVVEELPEVTELPEDIEESIHRYRGQLQRMGAVNPEAPAEYEETQQRFDFLTQQVEDLSQTDRQLRQVITELDDLTSRSFAQTVEKVDGIFGDMFTRLFGGGSAKLVLTEPDDLTISGVDIVARLPNRRQQGLGLLSGGERSLTAVALIFALLKVSPTPFCMMDEVDAMLDEANVNRFREALRELSLRTQFIVITHNRGTVHVAQTIYGISMGGDSASQVISIRPEEYVMRET
jgi:chromosome segregation protein